MDMNRRFDGQVTVVTGGASGIGLAIGKRLSRKYKNTRDGTLMEKLLTSARIQGTVP